MHDDSPAHRIPAREAVRSQPAGPSAGPARGAKLVPLLVFTAIAGLFAFALMRPGDPSKIPSALIGRAAPTVTLAALDGLMEKGRPVPGISPADFAQGSPVIVNFWASWCLPCVDEHPVLVALKARTGVTIFGINHKDQATGARRFLARYGNPYSAVGTDGNGRAAIDWGVYGMPETFILDGAGTIVFKHVGPLTPLVIETAVLPALDKLKRPR